MNEKIARLRTHKQNIDRYEGLLKSGLNEIELRFVEQRLSEERLALAMLQLARSNQLEGKMIIPMRRNSAGSRAACRCAYNALDS